MRRSIMDQLLLSMEPDLAFRMVLGEVSMIFIDGDLDDYTSRLFIHSTRYEDSDRAAAGTRFLLERGWQIEEIEALCPPCAILGWVKVDKVEPYTNPLLFESQIDQHRLPGTWADLLRDQGWTSLTPIHSVTFTDPHICKQPIVGIRNQPGEAPIAGSFWQGKQPIIWTAMKMATEPDRAMAIAEEVPDI